MIMFHVITRHLVKSCTMKLVAQEAIIIFGRGVWFVDVGYLSLNLVVRRSPWIEYIILDAARLPEVPWCQQHLSHIKSFKIQNMFLFLPVGVPVTNTLFQHSVVHESVSKITYPQGSQVFACSCFINQTPGHITTWRVLLCKCNWQ